MTVFVLEDNIFVSPNAQDAPVGFHPNSPCAETGPSLLDIRSPNRAYLQYPQLAYCLYSPSWSGPLLDRMDVTERSVEVERKHGRWLMEVTLQQSWVSLELALIWMARTLLSKAKGGHHTMQNVEFSEFRLPSSYGYGGTHETERGCRRAIMRSRNAFVPLMGLCSFAIAVYNGKFERTWWGTFPAWARALIENGAGHDWVSDLLSSDLANFSWTGYRVGVVVDVDETELWWDQLDLLVEFNVPLWFHWGTVGSMRDGKGSDHYLLANGRPTKEAIRDAFNPVVLTWMDPRPQPPVYPDSGQRPGEDVQAFLQRRNKENEELEESAADTQRRLQRIEHSRQFQPPGTSSKAAVVFRWVPSRDAHWSAYLLRERVPRWMVQDIWVHYAHTHMHYDGYRNEWDLWFAAEGDVTWDDDDETQACITPESSLDPAVCQDASRLAAALRGDAMGEGSLQWEISQGEAVFDSLRLRLGLLAKEDSDLSTLCPVEVADKKLCKMLGIVTSGSSDKAKDVLARVATALSESTPLPDIPHLWDPNRLGIHSGWRESIVISIEQREVADEDANLEDRQTEIYLVGVMRIASEDGTNNERRLLIKDPAVVVQLLRAESLGESLEEIAGFLVSIGAPFGVRDPHRRPLQEKRPPPGHPGWVCQGYQFNVGNYQHYEYVRNRCLQRGLLSLALRAGGLVWRLAKEMGGQEGQWEDELAEDVAMTVDEENIMCGVYKVYTGRDGKQTEDASWWPKQSVWLKGGLSVEIKSGGVQPKNAKAWKKRRP
ncbi:hypothetical protein EIP91_007462 [Steccherinum ochraceum]|uniref:Uncharacterized protein n=1 Tax=Steccherinum ochraceum TaxID=92696 RepID=A0A4R0RES6_9APHY|nr:hypothetical protein EIP91_007462 [Steccherinum ochraceum]